MKNLVIIGIVVGVLFAIVGAMLVLGFSGGVLGGPAESWARASSLAFLFAIAIALIPQKNKKI